MRLIDNSKRNNGKYYILFFVSFFLIFLISCSTTKEIFSFFQFHDSPPHHAELKNKDIAKFVSEMRLPHGNPDSHYLLASYYHESGRHKVAIKEFKKVILIDPGYVKAYNGIGVSYDQLGYSAKAVEYYKKALDLNPELDYVLNNLGYSYIIQGKPEDAIDILEKAVNLNNHNKQIHNNLGLAYANTGQFMKAFNEFKLAGDEARALYNIALIYFKKGLYNDAKGLLLKAITIKPSLEMAKLLLESVNTMAKIMDNKPAEKDLADNPDQQILMESETKVLASTGEMIDTGTYKNFKNESIKKAITHTASKQTDREKTSIDNGYLSVNAKEKSGSTNQQIEINMHEFQNKAGIEISNGNGVNGMAKRVGNYLKRKGYKVVRLTNADNFNHTETIIYYQMEYLQDAYHVAQQIPGYQNMGKTNRFDRHNVNIKLLIGKDIISYNKMFSEWS